MPDGVADKRPWWIDELVAVGVALLAGLPLLLGRAYSTDDSVVLGLPFLAVVQRAVAAGHVQGWTPEIYSGYSALGAGQSGMCYPLNWLLLKCFPLLWAWSLNYVIHYWLLARGMVGLTRRMGFGTLGVVAASAVALLGGAVSGHLVHFNVVVGMAWTTVILWLTVIMVSQRQAEWQVLLLALAVGMSWLQSHPQYPVTAFLIALFIVPWCRSAEVSWLAVAKRIGAGWMLGTAMASAQIVPLMEYAKAFPRPHAGGQFEWFTAISLRGTDFLRLFLPESFGTPWRGTHGINFLYWECRDFMGLTIVAAAVSVAVAMRRGLVLPRAVRAGLWLAVVSLLLAFGKANPAWIVLCRVPPLSLLRAPARFLFPMQLGVALLAGFALERLAAGELDRRARAWGAGVVAAGLVSAAATSGALGWLATQSAVDWLMAAIGLAGVLALWRCDGRRAAWAVLTVGLIELTWSWHAFGVTEPHAWFQPPPVAKIVAADANPRLFSAAWVGGPQKVTDYRYLVPPNWGLMFGIHYADGYDALPPSSMLVLQRDLARAYARSSAAVQAVMERHSIRYLAVGCDLNDPNLELVWRDGYAHLYRNLRCRPLAYAVNPVWLDNVGVNTSLAEGSVKVEPVEITRWEPGHVTVRTRLRAEMPVVLVQSLYPGWEATIDGQRANLLGAEHNYMSVMTPAGEHTLDFVFDNASVYLGLKLSQVMLLAWLLAAGFVVWEGRRRAATAASADPA